MARGTGAADAHAAAPAKGAHLAAPPKSGDGHMDAPAPAQHAHAHAPAPVEGQAPHAAAAVVPGAEGCPPIHNPMCRALADAAIIDFAPPAQRVDHLVSALRIDDPLADAVRSLVAHRMQAAPVIDAHGRVLGLLSLQDVACYLAQKCAALAYSADRDKPLTAFVGADTRVSQCIDFSGNNPIEVVHESTSALAVAALIAGGLRRVVVVDQQKSTRAVVTASDMLRRIGQWIDHPHYARLFATKRCESSERAAVATVSATAPLCEAIGKLRAGRVVGVDSPVAVVDGDGRLVASFSATDIKGVFESAPSMCTAVGAFLQQNAPQTFFAHTVKPDATLREVLMQFATSGVHQLWEVNARGQPIALVTQQDLLSALLATETRNAVHDAFESAAVFDLACALQRDDQRVIAVRTSEKLIDAVKLLQHYRLHCVPVIDESRPQIVGLLSIDDIVAYLVQKATVAAVLEDASFDLTLLEIVKRDATVQRLADYSGRNKMVVIRDTESAQKAMRLFAGGLHRLVLTDSKGCLRAQISQTDAIRYVHQHGTRADFAGIMCKTLAEVHIAPKEVRSVRASESLHAALSALQKHGGALAVVDDARGALIGNLSMSDFEALFGADAGAPTLHTPVGAFLRAHSPESLTPLTIALSMSLGEAVRQFAESHLHHFWVCGADGHVAGIVTQTDLLAAIYGLNM